MIALLKQNAIFLFAVCVLISGNATAAAEEDSSKNIIVVKDPYADAIYQEVGGYNSMVMEKSDKPLNEYMNKISPDFIFYYKGKPIFLGTSPNRIGISISDPTSTRNYHGFFAANICNFDIKRK